MKLSLKILTLFTLAILIIPFATEAQGELELFNLDIKTQAECEALEGTWNQCPPNECQRTVEYQSGEVACPEVCGSPTCQGIVPKNDQDLSSVHNPFIDQEIKESAEETPESSQPAAVNVKQLTIFSFLGLLLALAFVLLKAKNRRKDMQPKQE